MLLERKHVEPLSIERKKERDLLSGFLIQYPFHQIALKTLLFQLFMIPIKITVVNHCEKVGANMQQIHLLPFLWKSIP